MPLDEETIKGRIKRLKNLPSFKGKTDAELEEYVRTVIPKKREILTLKKSALTKVITPTLPITDYDGRYNKKFLELKDEFGVDMNDSNDTENLRMLVRLAIQLEDADEKIRTLTDTASTVPFDDRQLKNMGDYQRGLVGSITDLQDKLGITRKVRKEKQVDDIPQYLKEIRRKAKDFWNRSTTSVACERCNIELARYWLNFPDLAAKTSFELECWKCHDRVVFVR